MSDILFLAHRAPSAPDRGDRIRSFHVLKYLAAREDQKWDPNDEQTIQLPNGSGVYREKDVTDGSVDVHVIVTLPT